jgi:D-psicose/D-tagatose/L-ribulose 3-epimerase
MLRVLVLSLVFTTIVGAEPPRAAAPTLRLRYGVAAFGTVNPLESVDTLAPLGVDYIEPALSATVALTPEALAAARAKLAKSGIRVETMNWFLPGTDIKLTGPAVDRAKIRAYVEKSLALAESFGAKVIVFGSPGARSFPDGFPREKAWEQLKDFLRTCGDVIQSNHYGMVIGIEALRKPESNIINSQAEALKLAREVNHPKIRINLDFYHLTFENEDPAVILEARDMIAHLQIADPAERTFPTTDRGDPRYAAFFTNLRKIGYQGRISIEANSKDLEKDTPAAIAFLKAMAAKYGAADSAH